MKHLLVTLLVVGLLLSRSNAYAQTAGVRIFLLDRNDKPVTARVDGNQVSIKVELDAAVSADTQVDVLLAGLDSPVAGCTVSAGKSACQSDAFPALGWFWNPDGTPQPQ